MFMYPEFMSDVLSQFEKHNPWAYKVILKNRFVFLQNGWHPAIEQIVLWHEIERENQMKYEANVFAAQASLPDDTIIEYLKIGYNIQQIAKAMHSDINLIALKVDTLNSQGYQFRKQEHRNDFLKYNKQM